MTQFKFQTPVLAGHPFAPIGRGEDARCVFRAFRAAGCPLPIRNIYSPESQCDSDIEKEIRSYLVRDLSPAINLFLINGDEVERVLDHLSNDFVSTAYNIIYPEWELSIYPEEWAKQLGRFDEIWVPSQFVFDSVRTATSKPVLHMPLPVQVKVTSFLGRRYFGLPESTYLFLFFFDFRSYIDRKNPFAVIRAFEKVCAARPDEDVRLIIKLNRSINSTRNTADFEQFVSEINQCGCVDRIIVIDKVFTDNEIKNLVRCCDCFVSLHRSEGFGRGLAEAMFFGKPVVGTAYSGNLDFMKEGNSCMVRYKLIDVQEGRYPHAKGQVWAEPDIDHAVYHMLKLLDDRDYGRKFGDIASRHIRTYFSYRATGLKYKERLDGIFLERNIIKK